MIMAVLNSTAAKKATKRILAAGDKAVAVGGNLADQKVVKGRSIRPGGATGNTCRATTPASAVKATRPAIICWKFGARLSV